MRRVVKALASMAIFLFLLCVSACPVGAQTVVDQSFTSPNNLAALINECCAFVAQTFTAGQTGTLAGVNIDVAGNPNSPFPLHVTIRTVTSNGAPSSTILGETTLNSGSAPLSLLITFPQTINVVAGQQYAIVVNYQGAPPPGAGQSQGIWLGATGNVYTRGSLYSSVNGSSWFLSEPAGSDVHFQTYVTLNSFDACIQDDSNGNILQINTMTGAYLFTNCGGLTVGGTGTVIHQGANILLQHYAGNRRVLAKIDPLTKKATASVQLLSTGTVFTIIDRDITNDTCVCR